jgi:hypothetical protein
MKRDGNTVVNALYTSTLWTANSASKASGLFKQIEFAPILIDRLKKDPNIVVRDLNELRKYREYSFFIGVFTRSLVLVVTNLFLDRK